MCCIVELFQESNPVGKFSHLFWKSYGQMKESAETQEKGTGMPGPPPMSCLLLLCLTPPLSFPSPLLYVLQPEPISEKLGPLQKPPVQGLTTVSRSSAGPSQPFSTHPDSHPTSTSAFVAWPLPKEVKPIPGACEFSALSSHPTSTFLSTSLLRASEAESQ